MWKLTIAWNSLNFCRGFPQIISHRCTLCGPSNQTQKSPQISGTWFQNSLNCFEVDVLVTDFKSQIFFKSKCFVRFKDMNDLFISLVAIKLLFPAGGWTTTTNCIVYFRCVFIVTFGNVLDIVYMCLYILYSVRRFWFQHFLPNISKIIRVTRLCPSYIFIHWNEKSPILLLWNIRFHTQPKKVYDEFVSCKPYEKCQDDNVEKLREESREFPNGCKRC